MKVQVINMQNETVRSLREKLDARECSVAEVASFFTQRIAATNPLLNAFITKNHDVDTLIAHAQRKIDEGTARLLTGIPYAAKDLFCTKGIRTTAGSRILADYIPPYDATAIRKCHGALLLGKTNMDEFAMGGSCEHSAFGPTKNPYNLSCVSGGSSGGSAAAVAAGMVPFALGTDTGGSVRLPASFCNVVGLKPTYGRISRYGVIAMASSLDTVGVFTRTVEDAALVLQELAGRDGKDATALPEALPNLFAHFQDGMAGMRVGIPREFQELEGLDPAIKEVYENTQKQCTALGAELVEVRLPHLPFALAAYYILAPSEVSSNLARYDGMQFGTRAHGEDVKEVIARTREAGFGQEAKRRILIGTFCLSKGYVDAYYRKAQQVRTLIVQDFTEALRDADVLLAPSAPCVAFSIGAKVDDPVKMYLVDVCAIPVSLAGVPALSLPVGSAHDLPVGMQLIAPQREEARLLQAAFAVEQAMPKPPLLCAL